MEFRDLKTQYQVLKDKIDAAMIQVAQNSEFIMGKQVAELEAALAEYVGVKHCITCANGTDALSMVLMSWNIKKGDAVFVPNFTFFATSEVVSLEGATPIFVDVCQDTFNIDTVKLEEAIKKVIEQGELTPRAIISVDLFGLPADYDKLEQIAKKYNLLLLEDAAQGFGGMIGNKRACSFGDAATTSFFPAKPLGCYGDGGAIFTNDDKMADYLKSIRVHGKGTHKYDNVRIGLNSRLDTLQAAILLPKFDAFKAYELDKVNEVAKLYTEKLSNVVVTPTIPSGYLSSWAQYTIILNNRDQRDGLQNYLKSKDIPSMIYYSKPLHLQTAYDGLGYKQGDYMVTEMLCDCVLSLPMHPYMTDDDIELVSSEVIAYLSK